MESRTLEAASCRTHHLKVCDLRFVLSAQVGRFQPLIWTIDIPNQIAQVTWLPRTLKDRPKPETLLRHTQINRPEFQIANCRWTLRTTPPPTPRSRETCRGKKVRIGFGKEWFRDSVSDSHRRRKCSNARKCSPQAKIRPRENPSSLSLSLSSERERDT